MSLTATKINPKWPGRAKRKVRTILHQIQERRDCWQLQGGIRIRSKCSGWFGKFYARSWCKWWSMKFIIPLCLDKGLIYYQLLICQYRSKFQAILVSYLFQTAKKNSSLSYNKCFVRLKVLEIYQSRLVTWVHKMTINSQSLVVWFVKFLSSWETWSEFATL